MLMMRRHPRWALAALLALLAGIAAFFVSRAFFAPEAPPLQPARPAVIPERLPEVTLADRDGRPRALSEWAGRPLIINFWATWCAPCREEIPEFVRLQERYGARGLQFVGIAIDQPRPVAEFAREFRINYPLLIGGLDTMALMRESGNRSGVLPFTLILDRQGNIAGTHVGVLKEARFESLVRPLL